MQGEKNVDMTFVNDPCNMFRWFGPIQFTPTSSHPVVIIIDAIQTVQGGADGSLGLLTKMDLSCCGFPVATFDALGGGGWAAWAERVAKVTVCDALS